MVFVKYDLFYFTSNEDSTIYGLDLISWIWQFIKWDVLNFKWHDIGYNFKLIIFNLNHVIDQFQMENIQIHFGLILGVLPNGH